MTIFSEHAGTNPILAEVVRSGFTESWHRGAVAALAADGIQVIGGSAHADDLDPVAALAADGIQVIGVGGTAVPVFPRSANKPLQAVGMLRCRLDLEGELLALAAASHSGEDFHV